MGKEDITLIQVFLFVSNGETIMPHPRKMIELKFIPRKEEYFSLFPDEFYKVLDVVYTDLDVRLLLGKIDDPGVYKHMLML